MNLKLLFVLVCVSISSSNSFAQSNPEKSTVYFTRASSLGSLINFTFFDGEIAIGKFKGPGYFVYECEPGEHLFWARSENKSFVEATLKPGETYLIDVQPRMGGIKASVKLVPVVVSEHNMKRIQKLVSRQDPIIFSDEKLAEIQADMAGVIGRGMENYDKKLEKLEDVEQLHPGMTITAADLVFEKIQKK